MNNIDTIIIGAGTSGQMAFLRSVLNHRKTILFTGSGDTVRRARSTWIKSIDILPGFHDIKFPVKHMFGSLKDWLSTQDQFEDKFEIMKFTVTAIEKVHDGFKVTYANKSEAFTLRAKYVVMATGVSEVQPEINGSFKEILPFANSDALFYSSYYEGHKSFNKQLSILGLNDSALEDAIHLKSRYQHEDVSILTNGVPGQFTSELLQSSQVKVFESEIVEILGNPAEEGLTGYKLADGQIVSTNCTLVNLGVFIQNHLASELGASLGDLGEIKVNEFGESSVSNLFAIGNVTSGKILPIVHSWSDALKAISEIDRRLTLI